MQHAAPLTQLRYLASIIRLLDGELSFKQHLFGNTIVQAMGNEAQLSYDHGPWRTQARPERLLSLVLRLPLRRVGLSCQILIRTRCT